MHIKYFYSLLLALTIHPFISAQSIQVEKEIIKIEKIAQNDLMKAIKYADSILVFNFDDKEEIYLKNGYNCIRAKHFTKAVSLFKEVEKLNKEKKTSIELADAYIGLGQAHSMLENKDEAMNYALKALNYSRENKYTELESDALSILSIIYYKSADYHNAIKFTKQSLLLDNDNKEELSYNYNNLAVFNQKLKKLDTAQFYYLKTLDLNIELKDDYSLASTYNNIATINEKLKNYPEAIKNFKKAIVLGKKIKTNSSSPYRNLAKLYLKLNNVNQAKVLFEEALQIDAFIKDNKKQEKDYGHLLKIALEQKNYKTAFRYLKHKDSLSILNKLKQNKDNLKLINSKYTKTLEEEILTKKVALAKKNKIIFAVSIASLFMLLAFLHQRNRKKEHKLNQDKLILEQKVLRSQMNPHFIFNALTSIQKNLLEEDLLKSSTSLSKFAKLIRQNFEFTSKEFVTLDEDLNALKNYIETQKMRFEGKFDYHINIDTNIDVSYIKIPPMLLQPFIENAIEHGLKPKKEKGNLIINVLEKNNLIYFEIIDDGVGYKKIDKVNDREHATDIFFSRLKLRNLEEEKSFLITSLKNGKGTKVVFSLKI